MVIIYTQREKKEKERKGEELEGACNRRKKGRKGGEKCLKLSQWWTHYFQVCKVRVLRERVRF